MIEIEWPSWKSCPTHTTRLKPYNTFSCLRTKTLKPIFSIQFKMVFSSILRKSASSLAPLAIRLTRVNRNYHSAIFTASKPLYQKPNLGPFAPNLYFSTATETTKPRSDDSLLRIIDSEIKCAVETDDHDRVRKFPLVAEILVETEKRILEFCWGFCFFWILIGKQTFFFLFDCWENGWEWKKFEVFVVFLDLEIKRTRMACLVGVEWMFMCHLVS